MWLDQPLPCAQDQDLAPLQSQQLCKVARARSALHAPTETISWTLQLLGLWSRPLGFHASRAQEREWNRTLGFAKCADLTWT